MKYRYYILPEDGDIWGSNDASSALVAAAEDAQVIDTKEGALMDRFGALELIDEYEPPEAEEPEDDEDDA